MKYYLNHIIYQFRTQPVVMIMSLLGIAISLTFVMLFFMMNQMYEVGLAPESYRDRMLHVTHFRSQTTGTDGSSSTGNIGKIVVRECFYPLETAEAVTAYTATRNVQIGLPGQEAYGFEMKSTDGFFWKVFDFTFVDGQPFTMEALESSIRVAVIDENVARSLWGKTDVTGQSFELNYTPYKVARVVRPVSSQALWAYANLWIPYTTVALREHRPKGVNGLLNVSILAPEKKDIPQIIEECNKRVHRFNQEELAEFEWEINLMGQPDTQAGALIRSRGETPDLSAKFKKETMVLLLLLIVPAVNLSAMLNSRLRQRKLEIGVSRAFGATRARIMGEMFIESLCLSLAGGILGLFICLGVCYGIGHWLFPRGEGIDFQTLFTVLFRWQTFVWLLGACMILNLLSSGIPIWGTVKDTISNSLKEEYR